MAENVNPIPDGYATVTPTLTPEDCAEAIDFYREAFGTEEVSRAPGPDGPGHYGGAAGIWLFVEEIDAAFERAKEAGAEVAMEPAEMFWGDRMVRVVVPFGYRCSIASNVEEVSPEEMKRRQLEAMEEWGSEE